MPLPLSHAAQCNQSVQTGSHTLTSAQHFLSSLPYTEECFFLSNLHTHRVCLIFTASELAPVIYYVSVID